MSGTASHAIRQDNMAGTPASARRDHFIELQQRQLESYGVIARSEYLTIRNPQMRVHTLVAGKGEPVLFFHGGDGEAVDWAPLMAEMQNDAQLIGVDRPGFGLSDPFDYSSLESTELRKHAGDFVISVMDALGIEQATILGGSMGGFFALSAALDHPDRVKRLGLLGFAVGLVSDVSDQLKQLCSIPGAAKAFMQQAASLEAQHNQYRHMFSIDPDTVPQGYFETRLAGLCMPGVQDTWATLLTKIVGADGVLPGMYFGDELAKLKMPVALLWGEHDMAPAEVGEAALRSVPHGTFRLLEGVGHFPFLEAPAKTAAILREFFASQ